MNAWGKEGRPFFFLLDFDLVKPVVLPLDELWLKSIRVGFPNDLLDCCFQQNPGLPEKPVRKQVFLTHNGYPFDVYCKQFEKVMSGILAGDSFLVNLTCCTPVKLEGAFDDLFDRVYCKYKLQYGDEFLVFSPETFVRIRDGIIRSCPMKGTLDANLPDATNLLLNNAKEAAEHATIVDLIRNDLSMVAKQVEVSRYRYVDEIVAGSGKLLQVSSEVTGILPEDYTSHLGDILYTLLPAGSITGAPKKKTVEIIRSAENYQRGFYTGIFGIFDGKNLDSAVLIRFLENTPDGLVYKSGGGITAFSNLEDEYEEMLRKIYVPVY